MHRGWCVASAVRVASGKRDYNLPHRPADPASAQDDQEPNQSAGIAAPMAVDKADK
jgi:hypothetical protein